MNSTSSAPNVSFMHYGSGIPRNVPQLAVQYQTSSSAVSSIQEPIRWNPPVVPNVASSHPYSMRFAQEDETGPILYGEFLTGRFLGK